MSEQTKPEVRTYFGWQVERVAFMFGMSGPRVLMLGAASLLAVWPFTVADLLFGVIVWPIAAITIGLAFFRVRGRTADEWISGYVSYQLGKRRDLHKFASGALAPDASPIIDTADLETEAAEEEAASDAEPITAQHGHGPGRKRKRADLPGVLAPIEILEDEFPDGTPIAIVHHRIDKTFTAVARITYPGLGLVDTDRREQRVAGWGGLLAGLCTEGNPIIRVQAFQRLLPESGAALRRWHLDHVDAEAPEVTQAITEGLLSTATLATSSRESFLAFTMDARRAASAIRSAGGGTRAASTVLARHVISLTASIGGADLAVQSWLQPRELAEVVRSAFTPNMARSLAERREAADMGGLEAGIDPVLARPASAEARPGYYLHDGSASITYWVYDWPRSRTYSTVLAPLLGEGQHRRTFSMHHEPLGPRKAEKEVMKERTARSVAVRMRQRTGQIVPEHEQAALDRAAQQDVERANGHGLVRFTGLITVTVTDFDDNSEASHRELEDAAAALEADAAAARIEVDRMWNTQDIGFAMSALPLGYGLPKARWSQ
ncbi:SCO6880 family protein [Glycomyces niveus]|uniref:PrgI family protein n=1 Tax=Glycomyces niveus TaxID=2820287 RepID=A0ABS3U1Z2_9ACTN|nr:SCO6880 family protein [Glycomyces sp. NEAU-S30]MBO3732755.1 PrgI family protein [Glycomyces sp. NEAU-S30]